MRDVYVIGVHMTKFGKHLDKTIPELAAQAVEGVIKDAGVGKKVEWDGPNMKVTNLPELNQWLKRPYRQGWPV